MNPAPHPTPRTDARCFDLHDGLRHSTPDGLYVQADFARYMERELVEAQEAIRELNERGTSHLITMQDALQQACLERDQARAELRQARAELERLQRQKA